MHKKTNGLNSMLNGLNDMLGQLDNLKDNPNLTDEEKQSKAKEMMSVFEGHQKMFEAVFANIRQRQVKKEKISKYHMNNMVLNYKKLVYSILEKDYNSTIEDTTERVYQQLDELFKMEEDKSVKLRIMINNCLKGCRQSFIDSSDQAKLECQTQDEFESATVDFYVSFFNMIFEGAEKKYLEDEMKKEQEAKEIEEKHFKALEEAKNVQKEKETTVNA